MGGPCASHATGKHRRTAGTYAKKHKPERVYNNSMALFGSDQSLTIVIKARDEFSKVVDQVDGKLRKMQPVFQKMAVAGTIAFGGIALAAREAVQAYQESETA